VPRLRLILPCVLAVLAVALPADAGAAGWLPLDATVNTGGVADGARVAVDDAGNVYAAWTEGSFLEVSKRPVGGVFETPQTINTASGVSADGPDIGVDGAGNAVVVWQQSSGAGVASIQIARRAAGATAFGSGTTLSGVNYQSGGPPRIAVNSAGEAIVAYRDLATSTNEITAHLGTTTGNFTTRNAAENSAPDDPQVAINAAGDAVVIFVSHVAPNDSIRALYRVRGQPLPPIPDGFEIVDSTTPTKSDANAALDTDGTVNAVWTEGGNGTIADALRVNGKWNRLSDLDAPQSGGTAPRVTVESGGTAVAAWGGDSVLRASTRPPGSGFGPFQPLSEANDSPGDLALNSAQGTTALVWDSGNTSTVRALERLDGSAISPIADLSPAGHGGTAPDVAVDPHGNAAAVWIDSAPIDQNTRLVTAEFDRTPPNFSATTVPAFSTTGQPVSASATAGDDWSTPTITWDFGDGTTGSGGSISHTYAAAGTYNLTVTATDAAGNTRALHGTVAVSASVLPPVDVPTRGIDFNASRVSGTVLVSVPKNAPAGRVLARRPVAHGAAAIKPPKGFRPFRLLGKDDNIPVGSILDATKGTSSLTMATDKKSHLTQTGKFSLGVFRTKQTKSSALTTATLLGGGNFVSGCKRASKTRRLAKGLTAARKRPSRRLFANVKGRFRTRGRHSTATVRGTQYLVKDSCAGTTTKVVKGSVVVQDLVKHKKHIIRAGHSYLARPKVARRKHH
jgi:hypothetical protein